MVVPANLPPQVALSVSDGDVRAREWKRGFGVIEGGTSPACDHRMTHGAILRESSCLCGADY